MVDEYFEKSVFGKKSFKLISPSSFIQNVNGEKALKNSVCIKLGEWPSGLASSISLTEVEHGCVQSETRWATSR